jgi:hypothetical protein
MKPILTIAVLVAFLSAACGQTVSYFNEGFLRQPSAAADIAYLGITPSGLPGYVVTNTGTGYTLGGTFTGTFNGTYNTVLNGILQGNGVTMGTVTIGAGLSYVGTTLSAVGGSGTVTTFSAGNLSPLFTTSVANPGTTPALSFAQVSQNQNLVFASPDGAPGNPTFRALVAADVPAPAPSVFTNHSDVVPSTLQSGDIMAYEGTSKTWTNGQPASGGGGTSLPGLLTRPVSALQSGTLQAPRWPDDDTYYVDEEFDTWASGASGNFGRLKWTGVASGGGGAVLNIASNDPPYYGIIALQSPTAANNTFGIGTYGSTGLLPYYNLGLSSNWLFHAVFRIGITNAGSIYRLGLEDAGIAVAATVLNPSNCVMLRWDRKKNDPSNFIFEARSNATITLGNSSVIVETNSFHKLTFMSTNAGVVLCSIDNENWVTISNIPIDALCMAAMDSTTNSVAQFLWLDRMSFMASSMGR